jgi:hypothetical protein
MSKKKKKKNSLQETGGQTSLFKAIGAALHPEPVEELQKLSDFLGDQIIKMEQSLPNRISTGQLSAESKAEFESSGQGRHLRNSVRNYLSKQRESKAVFEIEQGIGRPVQSTGTMLELLKMGLCVRSEHRTKVNPKSGRRCSVYSIATKPFTGYPVYKISGGDPVKVESNFVTNK